MANMLENGVASMMETLLAQAGRTCTYSRDTRTASVLMHPRPQKPIYVQTGSKLTEIKSTDFLTRPELLPFGDPQRGDLITIDGDTYTVLPTVGEGVFRMMSTSMIRIHTKQTS